MRMLFKKDIIVAFVASIEVLGLGLEAVQSHLLLFLGPIHTLLEQFHALF